MMFNMVIFFFINFKKIQRSRVTDGRGLLSDFCDMTVRAKIVSDDYIDVGDR